MIAAVNELLISQCVGTGMELALELNLVKVIETKPFHLVGDFSPLTIESVLVPISAIGFFFLASHKFGASAKHLLIPGLVALLVLGVALLAYQELTSETGQARHVVHDVAADLATDSIYDLLLRTPRDRTFPVKEYHRVWYGYQVLHIETFLQRLKLLLILTAVFHSECGTTTSKLELKL
jgi:hypothetical protein